MSAPAATKGACAVTGASGYVGSRLAGAIAAAGWSVVTLGRGKATVPFTLADGVAKDALSRHGVQALVHCAYDFSARGWRPAAKPASLNAAVDRGKS